MKMLKPYFSTQNWKTRPKHALTENLQGKRLRGGYVNKVSRRKTREQAVRFGQATFHSFRALLIVLLFSSPALLQATTAQTVASMPTEGGVWTNPNLTIVINPATSTWYKQSYSTDAAYAVQRWSESIIVFTDSYGNNYLRQLTFNVYINNTVNGPVPSNPNVKISFVQNFPPPNRPALGVTQTRINTDNHFQTPITMRLAAQSPDGLNQLTDNDMTNIATHEFGHALGLDHPNTSTTDDNYLELMASEYNLPVGSTTNPLEAPSTLDLYALATIYSWLQTSPTLTGPGPEATSITLPASIPYTAVYPYPEQINALKTSLNQANQRILILAIIIIILLALTITLGVMLTRRKTPVPTPIFTPPQPPPTAPEPSTTP